MYRLTQLAHSIINFLGRLGYYRSRRHRASGARSLLFLCTGNICRSAYAEVRARSLFGDELLITLTSAGVSTTAGCAADPQAVAVASRRGIDLSAHQTTELSESVVEDIDLILAMEPKHLSALRAAFPRKISKAVYLGGYANSHPVVIKDPYGRSDEVFENCFDQIDDALAGLKEAVTGQPAPVPSRKSQA